MQIQSPFFRLEILPFFASSWSRPCNRQDQPISWRKGDSLPSAMFPQAALTSMCSPLTRLLPSPRPPYTLCCGLKPILCWLRNRIDHFPSFYWRSKSLSFYLDLFISLVFRCFRVWTQSREPTGMKGFLFPPFLPQTHLNMPTIPISFRRFNSLSILLYHPSRSASYFLCLLCRPFSSRVCLCACLPLCLSLVSVCVVCDCCGCAVCASLSCFLSFFVSALTPTSRKNPRNRP